VNLAMKSAKSCPLIDILDSNVTLRGLIFMTHFAILLVASGFSIMVILIWVSIKDLLT